MEIRQNLFDVHVGETVRRTSVNVKPVQSLVENEEADVRHGAQIDKIQNFIFEQPLINEGENHVLNDS